MGFSQDGEPVDCCADVRLHVDPVLLTSRAPLRVNRRDGVLGHLPRTGHALEGAHHEGGAVLAHVDVRVVVRHLRQFGVDQLLYGFKGQVEGLGGTDRYADLVEGNIGK